MKYTRSQDFREEYRCFWLEKITIVLSTVFRGGSAESRQTYPTQTRASAVALELRFSDGNLLLFLFNHSRTTSAEWIHNSRPEGSGFNVGFEQDVHFGGGSSLGLWEAEKRPDERQGAECGPDETAFAPKIPCTRVEDRWVEEVGTNAGDVVRISSQDDGLDSEAGRWDLAHQAVADGTNGEIVREDEDDQKGPGSPTQGRIRRGSDAEEANNQKATEENRQADDVELSPSDSWHQEP